MAENDEFLRQFRVTCVRPELAREVLDDKTCGHFRQIVGLARTFWSHNGVAVRCADEGMAIGCERGLGGLPQDLRSFVEHANAIFRRYREVMHPLTKMPRPARLPADVSSGLRL